MKTIDLFQVATDLLKAKPDDPAVWRTVMSRSYYSIFHLVGNQLSPADYFTKKPHETGVHEKLHIEIQSRPLPCDPWLQMAKMFFLSMKEDRVRADYYLTAGVSKKDAMIAIQRATRIIKAMREAGLLK
jgi:uncharacterized protein (UPF0332 family)